MQDGGADLSSVTNSTATTQSSDLSATSFQSTKPITRKTVAQKQKRVVHKKKEGRKFKAAPKDATRRLAREWGKRSSQDICSPIKGARVITEKSMVAMAQN